MSIDDACAFFKELVITHQLPAEMHTNAEGKVRIHVSRDVIPGGLAETIREEAFKRGFKDTSGDSWISFG